QLMPAGAPRQGELMIIDIYTHIFPAGFLEAVAKRSPFYERMAAGFARVKAITDLDTRFRAMDEIGDYRQVVSLPTPPLEDVTTPALGTELARRANDGMAELVSKHPERFPAFAAALAMHDMDGAMK